MGSEVVVRNVANVANLSTPLGLVVALAARGRLRVVDGLVVAERARLPLVTASAMTIGSVVLVLDRDLDDVIGRIPALVGHESEHAWQYAYCLGLPFLPAYLVATAWSWLRTGDRASANWFEVQAGLESGGYRPRERRPLSGGLAAAWRLARSWVSPAGDGRSGQPDGSHGGGAVA